ncbi:MAG: O-antigen ligase family protein [Candidatus Hodarchaeota archaeon]
MLRIRFETLKAVLTSEYWLVLTLLGAFFVFFGLNRGGVEPLMKLTIALLIVNTLISKRRLQNIPVSYWVFGTICAYLLLVSILVSFQASYVKWMANLVKMAGVVLGIHCLSEKETPGWIVSLFAIILSLTVCWQFAALHLIDMAFGTFTNQHYLATFAVLALPIVIYFFWITTGWYRFIFAAIAIMDADLLLRTGSRIAFLGIFMSTLLVLIFLVKASRKWVGIGLVCLVPITLYVADYPIFALRFKDFIENFMASLSVQSRIQLWTKAWIKIEGSSLFAWIFGHGIGHFSIPYTQDSIVIINHVSPHCYFLELLYLNGVIGVVVIFGGLTWVLFSLIRLAVKCEQREIRLLSMSLIVVLLTWFIHSGLTLPFYSKYSQYPLAFALGSALAFIEKAKRDMTVER